MTIEKLNQAFISPLRSIFIGGDMKKSARKPKRTAKKIKPTFISVNIPQTENLLSELEYGEELSAYFDLLYPEKIVESIHRPFYEMIIKKYNVTSACDLSCRTGQTLKLLSRLGIKKLTGVDASPSMLKISRKKLPRTTQFINQEIPLAPTVLSGQKFDLVLCTKDSLPLILDDESLMNFFQQARELLTDKGILIVETVNYGKIWKNKERFMPVMDRSLKNIPQLFFFINDFHQELLVRNLMRVERNKNEWYVRSLSIPIRPLVPNEIEFFVKETAFSKWGFLGSYSGKDYMQNESPYTILIAKR